MIIDINAVGKCLVLLFKNIMPKSSICGKMFDEVKEKTLSFDVSQ